MARLWILCAAAALVVGASVAPAGVINTSALSENGWYSDDTRSDTAGGGVSVGDNLVSPTLTDEPEASASGNPAHDPFILNQIGFGPAPGTVPLGTHTGAVNLSIAAGVNPGKSQISHRKDDATGHASGAALGPNFSAVYNWMGDGTSTITASFKLGLKTTDFGGTGTSSRTGENVWDKVLIYEPGNGNGGTSDGNWSTEAISFDTGKFWVFDRTNSVSSMGNPMTLSAMSTDTATFGGGRTFAELYDLMSDPSTILTSLQFGIGSWNAGGNVYVNQLETNFYREGDVTTFGPSADLIPEPCTLSLLGAACAGLGAYARRRRP